MNGREKSLRNILVLASVVALVPGVCVPGLAQLKAPNDASLVSLESSAPVASVAGPNLISPSPSVISSAAGKSSVGQSSAGKSSSGLSSLPPSAPGPISAALGKEDSGYRVRPNAEGLRAENPRLGLVVEFTQDGAEVRGHDLRWRLETLGCGYGDAVHRVNTVAPQAKANRVEYRRNGVTEWYENGPLGLEQGFTLAHPPGKANGQPLTMELGLRGNVVVALNAGGKELELRGRDGKAALLYTGLQARDATGRELRSWLEVRGERLLVRVADGEARYPVVVDPWIQQAELTSSDGVGGDYFGWSVAVSGSTIVVGASLHPAQGSAQGAAYVFVEGGGTWSQQAELTASDGMGGDYFGRSVAVYGSTVVVGAECHPSNSPDDCGPGAAYVFVESAGTWSQQAELTAADGANEDCFGYSVATSGSTIVVGAPFHPDTSQDCLPRGATSIGGPGSAYVFVESGGTWTQRAELTASDGVGGDSFGDAVAVSGSTIVVGANCHPYLGNQNCGPGAAYVFVKSSGTWSQQAELTASDGTNGEALGASVAISGSTVVAGAPNRQVTHLFQGAAYVFVESGGTWSQQAELTSPDGEELDYFGSSVAVSGSTAVVGAMDHPFGALLYPGQGAAYVFVENGGTWSQEAELTSSDGATEDSFGQSVAINGNTLVAGAPGHAVGSSGNQGAAYVFGSSGPLYTLSAFPTSLSVGQGEQETVAITITPRNGFSGSVLLSASDLPNGVTAVFSPNPANSTSVMTLTASATTATGTREVVLLGTSGSLAQTVMPMLTVTPTTTVTLSTTSLNFNRVAINNTSGTQTVNIKNTGGNTLDFSSITASADYSVSSTSCKTTLAVGIMCWVKVTFTPTQLGTLTGALTFTDNVPNSPQTVTLLGTGIEQATLTPASSTYAKQKVGSTSVPKKFGLANNQRVELTSIVISTTGDFAVSATTCGASLAAKGTCTVDVTFTPTAMGMRTGQLSISDSGSNSPQTSNLTGTGD